MLVGDKLLNIIDRILSTIRVLPELFHLVILILLNSQIDVIQLTSKLNLHFIRNKNLR